MYDLSLYYLGSDLSFNCTSLSEDQMKEIIYLKSTKGIADFSLENGNRLVMDMSLVTQMIFVRNE